MTTSAEARRALELLAALDKQEDQLGELSIDEELELVASGAIRRLNANRRWTLELAIGHALAAIAVSLEELNVDLPQNASQWLEDVKASIRDREGVE